MKKLMTIVVVAAVFGFAAAQALDNTWNGGGTNDWSIPAYWSLGHVPVAGETVKIGGTKTVNVTTLVTGFPQPGGGDTQLANAAGTVTLNINGGTLAPNFNVRCVNAANAILRLNITNGGSFHVIPVVNNASMEFRSSGTGYITIDGTSSLAVDEQLYTNDTARLYISMAAGSTLFADHLWLRDINTSEVTVLSGAGTVTASGTFTGNEQDAFRNNGRIEAIGGLLAINYPYTKMGANKTAYTENMADNQKAGYYATSGGTLEMPDVILNYLGSTRSVASWGNRMDAAVDTIPWINSLQFTGANMSGTVDVKLLALDLSSVKPGLVNPVGVWKTAALTGISGVTGLTLHYDDYLAATKGLTEANLKLLYNSGSGWANITSSIITGTDLIKGNVSGLALNGQFAVAADFHNAKLTATPPGGSTLDFGDVEWGGTKTLFSAVTLQSTGDTGSVVDLQGAVLTGPGSGAFSIVSGDPNRNLTVPASESFTIMFNAAGLLAGVCTADITFNNDSPQGPVTYHLTANVLPLPEPAGLGLVGLALLALRKRRS